MRFCSLYHQFRVPQVLRISLIHYITSGGFSEL